MARSNLAVAIDNTPANNVVEITDTYVYSLFPEDAEKLQIQYPEHRIIIRNEINVWDELTDEGLVPFIRPLTKARKDGKLQTAKTEEPGEAS